MHPYFEYIEYNDRKARAAPLKENAYCFILELKAGNLGSKMPLHNVRWVEPFLVPKILPNGI